MRASFAGSGPAGRAATRALTAWSWALTGSSAMLGFFLPFSTAGTAIGTVLVVLLLLARPRQLVSGAPWREPAMAVGLLLLAYIGLHTLGASGWTREAGATVNRYHELLICPLLLAAWTDERARRAFFAGLIVGLVGLMLAHWAARVAPQLWPNLPFSLYVRRISAGFGLTLGAFLLATGARLTPFPVVARVLAACMAATVLFMIDGRTGHVVLLILSAFMAWMAAPRRWRWAAMVAVPLVLAAAAALTPGVQARLKETLQGQAPAAGSQLNSTGIRMEFTRLSLDLAARHWLAGAGYGNYSRVHEEAARARYAADPARAGYLDQEWVRTPNPHNEYALQLVGGGIVGLGLYVAWLGLALRRGLGLAPPLRALVAGTVVAFAAGSLFNSLLMDFIEGHLYTSVLAALLAAAAATPRRAA